MFLLNLNRLNPDQKQYILEIEFTQSFGLFD